MRAYVTGAAIDAMLTRGKEDVLYETTIDCILVAECGEELVRIQDVDPRISIDIKERRRMYDDETLYARASVAHALAAANRALSSDGLALKVFDAYRPLEYQQMRFEQQYKAVREQNPGWSEQQVRDETFIRVFPPSTNPQTPPAHSTGGAIDLTIVDNEGNELDMGSGYGEFESPYLAANAPGLDGKPHENRVLLITTMAKQGFMCFPGEWWHYSMGDREWSAYLGLPYAIYGRMNDPYKQKA